MARQPGTPPKGAREAVTTRVPPTHKAHYEECAKRAGMGLSDWVAMRLAQVERLDEPGWLGRGRAKDPALFAEERLADEHVGAA